MPPGWCPDELSVADAMINPWGARVKYNTNNNPRTVAFMALGAGNYTSAYDKMCAYCKVGVFGIVYMCNGACGAKCLLCDTCFQASGVSTVCSQTKDFTAYVTDLHDIVLDRERLSLRDLRTPFVEPVVFPGMTFRIAAPSNFEDYLQHKVPLVVWMEDYETFSFEQMRNSANASETVTLRNKEDKQWGKMMDALQTEGDVQVHRWPKASHLRNVAPALSDNLRAAPWTRFASGTSNVLGNVVPTVPTFPAETASFWSAGTSFGAHVQTAGCLVSRCAWSAGAQDAPVVHWVVYPPSEFRKFATDLEDYRDFLDGYGDPPANAKGYDFDQYLGQAVYLPPGWTYEYHNNHANMQLEYVFLPIRLVAEQFEFSSWVINTFDTTQGLLYDVIQRGLYWWKKHRFPVLAQEEAERAA